MGALLPRLFLSDGPVISLCFLILTDFLTADCMDWGCHAFDGKVSLSHDPFCLHVLDLTAAVIHCPCFLIRYFQSTCHSELGTLFLWSSLPDSLFDVSSGSKSFSAGFLHQEKLVLCSQLTSQSLMIFCCYCLLLLWAMWILGSVHQNHHVTRQSPGPTLDQLSQHLWERGQGSTFFTSVPHGF